MDVTCKACNSERVLRGPFYSQEDIVCMDCGHREEVQQIHFAPSEEELEEERAQQKMSEAAEVLKQELTMDIMQDPEKMAAYLKSLKQATQVIESSETPAEKPKKARSRKTVAPTGQGEVETKAELGLEPDLIWQAIHVYQRRGSSWQQTLSDAKGEKEYRNDNVILFAHEHNFGEACSNSCRQV